MKKNCSRNRNEDRVTIRLDITMDLPDEIAYMADQLGIYRFERCTYDMDAHRITASVTTTLYKSA